MFFVRLNTIFYIDKYFLKLMIELYNEISRTVELLIQLVLRKQITETIVLDMLVGKIALALMMSQTSFHFFF